MLHLRAPDATAPPLFAADGLHKDRQWTLQSVLHRLQAICREKVALDGVEFEQVTVPENGKGSFQAR